MRIRIKLITAMVIVAVTAISLVAVTTGLATSKLFDTYVFKQGEARALQWATVFTAYYAQNGTWEGVQKLLNIPRGRGGRGSGWREMAEQIVLTDDKGMVVADSEGTRIGRFLDNGNTGKPAPITWEGQRVGYLYYFRGATYSLTTLEAEFRRSVTRAVVWGGLGAALLAAGLGIAFSHRLTYSLLRLTDAAGKLAGKDLTHRVAVTSNDEIGELARAFNTMATSLEHYEQVRQNLVADVAHELRTPLAILRGNLESIQEGVVEPTPVMMASLYDEVLRMSRLVADLQNLSLAEAGKLPLSRSAVDLGDLVDQVQLTFAYEAAARGITLSTAIPPDLPPAYIDPDRITQVMLNLLSNALRYTCQGGSVHLGATAQADHLRIMVTDNGPGISPADLPHIFNRFYRADKTRSRAEGGSGLGLAIAKGFVEAHGGRIWAESRPGEGSTFYFTLPRADRTPVNP